MSAVIPSFKTVRPIQPPTDSDIIAIKVAITIAIDPLPEDHVVAVAANTPAREEDIVMTKSPANASPSWSTTIQTAVTRVVAVYELRALVKVAPTSATMSAMSAPLRESQSRKRQHEQKRSQ